MARLAAAIDAYDANNLMADNTVDPRQLEIIKQNIEAVRQAEWELFYALSGGKLAKWALSAFEAWRAARAGMKIVEQVDDIVEIAGTVDGHEIRVLANMSKEAGTLFLKQAHIQGPGPGKVGVKALFAAVREFGKSQGVTKVVVEGAKRTTGAGNQRGAVPRAWEILVK